MVEGAAMPIRKGILAAVMAVAWLYASASAQEPARTKELTARELFYVPAAAPKPAATPPAPARHTAPPKTVAKAPVKPPVQTASRTPKTTPPPAPPSIVPGPGATIVSPDGTGVITVSAPRRTAPAPTAGPPLGLRYTITKLIDGKMAEVSPESVFRAGDRIKITVVPNSPGYLYIINQGSSGTWKPIFPSPEIEDGNNRVDGFRDYAMPPKSRMIFDSQPGTERLFVVLSREPEPDFEQLIYSLQTPRTKPSAAEPETPAKTPPRTMVAANISNDTVGRLRNVYARDLVVEKVDEETPGEKQEKAVYVVNPSGSANSRVVADIVLVHQ
jgi:hypothetical protein